MTNKAIGFIVLAYCFICIVVSIVGKNNSTLATLLGLIGGFYISYGLRLINKS